MHDARKLKRPDLLQQWQNTRDRCYDFLNFRRIFDYEQI
jgi:hypothetical protein